MTTAENNRTTTQALWQKLRPPEGQTLVWWLIDLQRGTTKQIIAVIAFLLAFHYLFRWSWSMSIALILSMFLHECGHALVFRYAHIRFIILYLFPLGAVAAPVDKEEDARSDLLHWNTISWLLQAGPAVNVGLILLFLGLQPLIADPVMLRFAKDMVYVNGLLASMNLVPLWTLDAGQLFKVIYNSLEEREDNWLTGILLAGVVILLLFIIGVPGFVSGSYMLFNTLIRFGWVVFLIFFALGILNKQGRDEPLHAFSKQAMNNRQVLIHLMVYTLQVGITLWVFAGPLL
jgi:Zn-dependent protease